MKRLLILAALLAALLPTAGLAQFSNASKLRGRNICTDAPADTQVYSWSASRQCWAPITSAGSLPTCTGGTTTSCVVYADGSGNVALPGNLTVGNTVLLSGMGPLGQWIPDTANTVAHVISTSAGLVDTKSNSWLAPLIPLSYVSQPPALAYNSTRTLVGPFSSGNYFTQGSAGSGLPAINGALTVCVAFTLTSYSNGPILFANLSGGQGYRLYVSPSGNVTLGGTNGYGAATSPSFVAVGSVNVACGGFNSAGTMAYIQLNGGPISTSTVRYSSVSAGVCTFGANTADSGNELAGQIDEMWFSTDTPSAPQIQLLIQGAIAYPGAGYRFPDTAGTVLHLLGRNYSSATWTTPQATLTTVGTVGSSTYLASIVPTKQRRYGIAPLATPVASGSQSSTAYYYLASGNVLDFSGNFSACLIVVPQPSDISNTSIYVSSGVSEGTAGWQVVNESGATDFWGTSGGVTTGQQLVANSLNTVCFGKSGSNLLLKINDNPTITTAGTITVNGGQSRLGMHWNYDIGFAGTLYEAWFSTDTPTDTLFSSVVSSVLLVQ